MQVPENVVEEPGASSMRTMRTQLPPLSTAWNPQRWWASSAPWATSGPLWAMRRRALKGNGGGMVAPDGHVSTEGLAYIGHTAEIMRLKDDGQIESTHPDPDDIDAVALANPAFGPRISEEYCRGERAAMGDEMYLRERLGVGEPEPVDLAVPAKMPADRWEKSVTSLLVDVVPGRCVLGLDATPGGRFVSIGIGAGTPDNPYVELVEHEQGTGWVPGRIVELVARWRPLAVGIDAQGPAGGLVGTIRAALVDAKLDPEVLRVVTFGEMKQW